MAILEHAETGEGDLRRHGIEIIVVVSADSMLALSAVLRRARQAPADRGRVRSLYRAAVSRLALTP